MAEQQEPTLAEQFKTWCLYLLEHGTAGNVRVETDDKVKYIYGMPLRLPTDHMQLMTPMSMHLLENNKKALVQLLQRNSQVHLVQLEQKQDCSLTLPCARACFTFNPDERKEVAVCILVHKPCSVERVNLFTMLKQTYIQWLLRQAGLTCTDFVMMFSIVNVTMEQASKVFDDLDAAVDKLQKVYTFTCDVSDVKHVLVDNLHFQ